MDIAYSRGFLKSASRLPKRIIIADRKRFFVPTISPELETHKLLGKTKVRGI